MEKENQLLIERWKKSSHSESPLEGWEYHYNRFIKWIKERKPWHRDRHLGWWDDQPTTANALKGFKHYCNEHLQLHDQGKIISSDRLVILSWVAEQRIEVCNMKDTSASLVNIWIRKCFKKDCFKKKENKVLAFGFKKDCFKKKENKVLTFGL